MPQDRRSGFVYSPHTQETDVRKPNTLIIDDLKLMLVNYKENPEKWTPEYIAARFDISKEIAGNLTDILYESSLHSKLQMNILIIGFSEKLVVNYSTLQTYFAEATSESDKYLHREEEEIKRIRPNSTLYETEDIMTAGVEKKFKTRQEFEDEWSAWIKARNNKN